MLTTVQLTDLIRKLEDARRASTGPGLGNYCEALHVGQDGKTFRIERKPKSKRSPEHKYPDGTVLKQDAQGLYIEVPLGVHGRGHLGIDPATGEIACTLCRKGS